MNGLVHVKDIMQFQVSQRKRQMEQELDALCLSYMV